MEKYIWIVKSVHTFNGSTKTDNLFAVTSEDEAKNDVEKFNAKQRMKKTNVDIFNIWYIYEKIKLYE